MTVVYTLNKGEYAIYRNQEVTEIHKEDGIVYGLWQGDKLVARYGQSDEWCYFGHKVNKG